MSVCPFAEMTVPQLVKARNSLFRQLKPCEAAIEEDQDPPEKIKKIRLQVKAADEELQRRQGVKKPEEKLLRRKRPKRKAPEHRRHIRRRGTSQTR